MSWVAAGVMGGASALGSIMGGNAQKKAAKKAAKYRLIAQREAAERLKPWRERGDMAANEIQALMGLGENKDRREDFGAFRNKFEFEKDAGYDFRRAEGEKGVANSASARGMALSGAALKALNRYNQDYASNEYQNAYNRHRTDRSDRFNMLTDLSNKGMGATNNLNSMALDTANYRGDMAIQRGNATAGMWKGVMNAGANAFMFGKGQQNQDNMLAAYKDRTARM